MNDDDGLITARTPIEPPMLRAQAIENGIIRCVRLWRYLLTFEASEAGTEHAAMVRAMPALVDLLVLLYAEDYEVWEEEKGGQP